MKPAVLAVVFFLAFSACSGGRSSVVPAKTDVLPAHLAVAELPPPMPTASPLAPSVMTSGSSDRRGAMIEAASHQGSRGLRSVAYAWSYVPAAATQVAYAPDGTLWALSTAPAGPDKSIWKLTASGWANVPGGAQKIAIGPDGSPWAMTSFGFLYHYVGSSWVGVGGQSQDITVDPSGNVFVVGKGSTPDNAIYEYSSGGVWRQVQGYAARLSSGPDSSLYAVTSQGALYDSPSFGAGSYLACPGAVNDVAPVPAGAGFFALGFTAARAAGSLVYAFSPSAPSDCRNGTYQVTNGFGVSLSAMNGQLAVVGTDGAIYTASVQTSPTPAPVPTASTAPSCSTVTATTSMAQQARRSASSIASVPMGDGTIAHRFYVKYDRALATIVEAQGETLSSVRARLANDPSVVGVYPLHTRRLSAASRVTVNDYEFNRTGNIQWSLDVIRATYAWTYTTGSRAKVAVIDTGVDLTHPDFPSTKVVYEASAVGGVVSTTAKAAQDTNGHGTNVAGIAAAATNNCSGYAGVGYNAGLLAYKIFPDSTATSDEQTADTGDEAYAISDAVARGADVINLSLGAPQTPQNFDQAESDAVAAAIKAGVVVVAAAGNESTGLVDYPAGYPGVIAVGAAAINDQNTTILASRPVEYVASYSNYGTGLSIVAPGGDTSLLQNTSASDNLHWIINASTTTANFPSDQCRVVALPDVCGFKFQGTSQATPHVTGAVALIQSALRERGKATLTPAQMKSLLESTADNIGDPHQGNGRLNVLRAIETALGVPLTP